jgi:hypothetical protein
MEQKVEFGPADEPCILAFQPKEDQSSPVLYILSNHSLSTVNGIVPNLFCLQRACQ